MTYESQSLLISGDFHVLFSYNASPLLVLTIESWSLYENQALYDVVDDAGRLDQSIAAGGDRVSQGREQNLKARVSKSYWQKTNHLE